jgi:D-arginine dehydrogenase
VRRVEDSWTGLRTFTPDGTLAFGWDAVVAGFSWCEGPGAPAAGRFVNDPVLRRDPGESSARAAVVTPARFVSRRSTVT